MSRLPRPAVVAVLAAAALSTTGCKKEQSSQAEGQAPRTETSAAQAPSQPAAPVEQRQELVINDDVVDRYLAYWDKYMELMRQVSAEVDTTLKELQQKGEVQGSMQALHRAQQIERKLTEQSASLRREYRFEENEVDTLQDFFTTLGVNLQLMRDMPVEQMLNGLRAQLSQVPAEQRAQAEQEIAQLEEDFKAQSELRDLREQYGDAAVDAALKHKDRIAAMQDKQIRLFGDVHGGAQQP